MDRFELKSDYQPRGDQPEAIRALVQGLNDGLMGQTLLGVTGSGKTFTMANVIQEVQRPTLVLAHNKTLAAQLCSEFKEFFPTSAVEYFVSYYDYYQPEAYIASSDTYIEKDSAVNEEIDRLRHSATAALTERRDVIIVASVSCIYSLGDPKEYANISISIREGQKRERDDLMRALIEIQYERNDIAFVRGTFRVRGDVVEIIPAGLEKTGFRVEFFGDEIERISQINVLTGEALVRLSHAMIFPASHYATSRDKLDAAIGEIESDLEKRLQLFKEEDRLLEAQRLLQRTNYDIEMMREVGYCSGIENYSRYFDGREVGQAPYTLIDYFPDDFLMMIDESHVSVPQVRAMFAGDFARKSSLVDYGFRLPSAFENRPLKFHEFEEKIHQTIYVSATPGPYEKEKSSQTVEQIIRPTGLLDPEIIVRPATGQVDDLLGELRDVVDKGFKVLVTTLTKKMAESLTDYLLQMEIRVKYLHSDIDTMDRMKIIRGLRLGEFDVLVGINLLREGLDLPEVALVAILDADKEGFLRSETALIQTVGRAARNVEGRVVMYADRLTNSMLRAIDETNRRRGIQLAYNQEHGITPTTIRKAVADLLLVSRETLPEAAGAHMSDEEKQLAMQQLEEQMIAAASDLDFERAARLRDQLFAFRGEKVASAELPQRRKARKKR